MNRLKNIFLTLCCSFTLVIIINCLFSTLFVDSNYISLKDVYMVFFTCFIVSLVVNCFKLESVYSHYLSVMSIIFLMEYIFYGNVILMVSNIIPTIVIMSFFFFVVYLSLFYVNDKDAKRINSMINKSNS